MIAEIALAAVYLIVLLIGIVTCFEIVFSDNVTSKKDFYIFAVYIIFWPLAALVLVVTMLFDSPYKYLKTVVLNWRKTDAS